MARLADVDPQLAETAPPPGEGDAAAACAEARSFFEGRGRQGDVEEVRAAIGVPAFIGDKLRAFARENPAEAAWIERCLGFRRMVLEEFDRLLRGRPGPEFERPHRPAPRVVCPDHPLNPLRTKSGPWLPRNGKLRWGYRPCPSDPPGHPGWTCSHGEEPRRMIPQSRRAAGASPAEVTPAPDQEVALAVVSSPAPVGTAAGQSVS